MQPAPPATMPRPEELDLAEVTLGSHALKLFHVRDLDAFLGRMLTEQPYVNDDDIPYYAWLWPTARVLATHVLDGPALDGVHALELGCGVGLVGLAAARQGARVVLTDLQEGALMLARRNAEQLDVADRVDVQKMDWRVPVERRFDLVLGSDVLYEARFAEPLAAALDALLAPLGHALLGDPSRPHVDRFLEQAQARGLVVTIIGTVKVPEGSDVNILRVARRGAPP